MNNRVVIVLS